MKQLSKERARGLRVMQRLDTLRVEEREKVKAGKKPFFLKNSVKNTINLEEKYGIAFFFCILLLLVGIALIGSIVARAFYPLFIFAFLCSKLIFAILLRRYKELKKDGKLHKFMEKRRKKNSNKDHRWLPQRRSED